MADLDRFGDAFLADFDRFGDARLVDRLADLLRLAEAARFGDFRFWEAVLRFGDRLRTGRLKKSTPCSLINSLYNRPPIKTPRPDSGLILHLLGDFFLDAVLVAILM